MTGGEHGQHERIMREATEKQQRLIEQLRATGLMGDATDREIWQAALRIGERHGAGTALRDPSAVARELGREEDDTEARKELEDAVVRAVNAGLTAEQIMDAVRHGLRVAKGD